MHRSYYLLIFILNVCFPTTLALPARSTRKNPPPFPNYSDLLPRETPPVPSKGINCFTPQEPTHVISAKTLSSLLNTAANQVIVQGGPGMGPTSIFPFPYTPANMTSPDYSVDWANGCSDNSSLLYMPIPYEGHPAPKPNVFPSASPAAGGSLSTDILVMEVLYGSGGEGWPTGGRFCAVLTNSDAGANEREAGSGYHQCNGND